jgi:hypothetical protein
MFKPGVEVCGNFTFGENIGQELNVSEETFTALGSPESFLIKQFFLSELGASNPGVFGGNEGQDPAIETWTGDMP